MTLKRIEHWETRAFHTFLEERCGAPFVWGENDCALFAADAIKSITGIDIAESFRGKYSDEASAIEAIKTITGGSTLTDAAVWCATRAGLAELKYPLMARRGDLVLVDRGDGTLIAGVVHLGGAHAVSVGPKGLVRLRITSIVRAWHYE
jgi:hypothetical protein